MSLHYLVAGLYVDYKTAIKPHAGFNPAVIQELIKTTGLFTGHQRNIVVIRRNEDSADLVGYVDLGDPDLNYPSFKNQDDLVTPVLLFYVTGLTSKLKFELGYYHTKLCVPFGEQSWF